MSLSTLPRWLIPSLLVLILLVGGYALWQGFGSTANGPSFRMAKIERGAVVSAVSASGTLAPVTQVQVGSQVSGQIKEILADFNAEVKAGAVIARIDPESFEAKVAQAAAELEVAKAAVLMQQAAMQRAHADVLNAQAGLATSRADTQRAEITALDAQREFERQKELSARGVASQATRDRQEASAQGATAQVRASRAQEQARQAAVVASEASAKQAEAQLANAEAVVKQRDAALRQAQIDLDRTFIRSPVDGVVILRNIDAGQTVAASLQAPILFTIAETLTKMQVETSVDEADIGRLAEGMAATFTVDSLPGRTFNGTIRQIRKSPQVVQNVVTYTVVISADNPDLKLLPGMTANVRVVADQRDAVLKVPNSALRFRPPASVKVTAEGGAAAPSQPAQNTGGGGQGGGPNAIAAVRDRLIKELQLTPAQIQALDAIFAETRQKIIALPQELDETQRRQGIERARAESRARIAEMLNPEQKQRYLAMAGDARRGGDGRVHVKRGDGLVSLPVRIGISDGAFTEMIGGPLKEGDEVVIGVTAAAPAQTPPAGPGAPRLRL